MKKIILLLALCFTANNFFAQTTDPNQLKNEGNDALNAKNYAVAFEKYSEYLKLTNNQDSVTKPVSLFQVMGHQQGRSLEVPQVDFHFLSHMVLQKRIQR